MNRSIILENVSQEELYLKLREIISEEISKQIQPEKPRLLLTKQEVADKLRLSLATVKRMASEGSIKGYRVGRRILFKSEEIEQSLIEIKALKYKRS
jgi:excisionase family DNA binding protein